MPAPILSRGMPAARWVARWDSAKVTLIRAWAAAAAALRDSRAVISWTRVVSSTPVSYTHLTLPTSDLV